MDLKPIHATRNKQDGNIYNKARSYIRKAKPKSGWIKIKNNPRENVAIIKLRRLGYSFSHIQALTGRSLSYLHRIIKTAVTRGTLKFFEKRTMPHQTRMFSKRFRMAKLMKFWVQWELYIQGEAERPP